MMYCLFIYLITTRLCLQFNYVNTNIKFIFSKEIRIKKKIIITFMKEKFRIIAISLINSEFIIQID